jgi:hypothetical protein
MKPAQLEMKDETANDVPHYIRAPRKHPELENNHWVPLQPEVHTRFFLICHFPSPLPSLYIK